MRTKFLDVVKDILAHKNRVIFDSKLWVINVRMEICNVYISHLLFNKLYISDVKMYYRQRFRTLVRKFSWKFAKWKRKSLAINRVTFWNVLNKFKSYVLIVPIDSQRRSCIFYISLVLIWPKYVVWRHNFANFRTSMPKFKVKKITFDMNASVKLCIDALRSF